MQKKQTFNFKETNVSAIGGDLDKSCREAAAANEKQWIGAGSKVGLQIWRIEKFQVVPSKTPPGVFYSDDSYIVLSTYEDANSGKLRHDIHFWLGVTTSQDESGTAAYKTVELDDLLGGEPTQHREVQDHESKQFIGYFEGGVRLLAGGVASGFNHVKPEEYQKRLLHIKGRKVPRIAEVECTSASMNSGDSFILDNGLQILQWNGSKAGIFEKNRAAALSRALDDERKGAAEITVYAQGDKDEGEFWAALGDDGSGLDSQEGGDDAAWEKNATKRLFKLEDDEGKLEFSEVAGGDTGVKCTRDLLDSDDVMIFDVGNEVFAWIGKNASKGEKSTALHFAQDYLTNAPDRPSWLPVTRILEGGENEVFTSHLE
mmetsp:Transcript_5736/g.6476  ORF Transcript_5736/g.6476 Transcript_5736/m.6476 type:complete len:373 (-) Transcript_5736:40-1158(-)|eukprot:CAMPEP_0205824462 /NCGR_PEP_ID=MMETSP0206-20130828/21146_1 /ASSEMBLY_ACC=CAM_ASM_000279 /TAXON_ID=36767 /ORGANISM="Euplotes focardii, Strain TN1" /LENGTH=372 /DNA_ID=CAMNT_0053122637 /DNA_START=29 /DNA_END=1147 /DNA_ORIENTATION=+